MEILNEYRNPQRPNFVYFDVGNPSDAERAAAALNMPVKEQCGRQGRLMLLKARGQEVEFQMPPRQQNLMDEWTNVARSAILAFQ